MASPCVGTVCHIDLIDLPSYIIIMQSWLLNCAAEALALHTCSRRSWPSRSVQGAGVLLRFLCLQPSWSSSATTAHLCASLSWSTTPCLPRPACTTTLAVSTRFFRRTFLRLRQAATLPCLARRWSAVNSYHGSLMLENILRFGPAH